MNWLPSPCKATFNQSNLIQTFIAQLNFDGQIPKGKQSPANSFKTKQVEDQVQWLQKIGEQVGVKLTKAATKDLATAGQGFLRSRTVAGSTLHTGVYDIGTLIGFKFKPWQAARIAKNIGNAAKFLGPALSVVSIGLELHGMHKEREREQQMADIRRDITSQFKTIAVDLEQQIQGQLQEFEAEVYGKIEQNIAQARQETVSAMTASTEELQQIAAIRKTLDSILQEVQRVATSG